MRQNFILIFSLAAIIITSACVGANENQEQRTTITETQPTTEIQENETSKSNTIEITSSGFAPNELRVKAGASVIFVNKDTIPHWPASAVHPTHKVYHGSGIEKCGTAEEKNIFDACRGLVQGESWSFVFNEKGSWTYHDHLNPGLFGKIIVE